MFYMYKIGESSKMKPKVVSTFSGTGGSCLGYKRAGCEVVLASDFEQKAVDTYKMNYTNLLT